MTTRPCTTCRDPISTRRLAAMPDAQRCVKCQVEMDEPIRVADELMVESSSDEGKRNAWR